VSTVSGLLERDGTHVRTELRMGWEWTNQCRDSKSGQEWVALIRTQLGVGVGCDALSIPYAMPAESLCVGAFVGYKSQGTTAIGCVARMCGGEIWVVPGSTAPSDRGLQRLKGGAQRCMGNGCGLAEVVAPEWSSCRGSGDGSTLRTLMTRSSEQRCGCEGRWRGN
jgi:hypothetical protein